MDKPNPAPARIFPSAQEDAEKELVSPQARYEGPESAYRLAFTDTDFLLREELRPIRLQLELLKPELVQDEQGVETTIVLFGSARILAPEAAERELATIGEGIVESRREYQRAVDTAEKAKSEIRSLLMSHLSLIDRAPAPHELARAAESANGVRTTVS